MVGPSSKILIFDMSVFDSFGSLTDIGCCIPDITVFIVSFQG
jgi:hypothetical protein